MQLASYRRFGDQRYYKGVEYANILEALARRRAADAFAANGIAAEGIRANVQPLSGSPANNAVYAALVPVGSTIMGMDLLHGGHLTHGSPASRSGKLYRVVSAGLTETNDSTTMPSKHSRASSRLIIAGLPPIHGCPTGRDFDASPTASAYLLADISHHRDGGGAIVASPIGHAHVVSFTTHKTLYGPRGACILTTEDPPAKIDAAVFPGGKADLVNASPGWPSPSSWPKQMVARLQQQVVDNARISLPSCSATGLHILRRHRHACSGGLQEHPAADGVSPDGRRARR
jgi:glycine hydroxymethyltransferase